MIHELTVVSLGPGDPDLVNQKTISAIRETPCLVLLTRRHKMADWLSAEGIPFSTLDHLFDSSDDFDSFHHAASDYFDKVLQSSPAVFAVPDASSDLTVRFLLREKKGSFLTRIIPGTGYHDYYLSQAMEYAPDSRLHITSAYDLLAGDYNPNEPLLILEIDNELLAGDLKVFLGDYQDDDAYILFMQADSEPALIPLYDLDRQSGYDHQSAALIPPLDYLHRKKFVLPDLIRIMEKLRSPEGCPWDRKQTHVSLRPYLIEEAWECVASIDQNDMDHLAEELGDLLFQIVFHASIGKQFDEFSINDIYSSVCLKMIRRHPHVFMNEKAPESQSANHIWEKIKRDETGRSGVAESLDDISPFLPSLTYAGKTYKKLHSDEKYIRPADRILDELLRCLQQLKNDRFPVSEDTAGLILMLLSELCIHSNIDGELALRRAADRLIKSVQKNEGKALKSGL